MIADPEVRQVGVVKSLTTAGNSLRRVQSRVLHSTYGVQDGGVHQRRLHAAFDLITNYIAGRLLLEETLPPVEPEPVRAYFICKHGHKHRSKQSLLWCKINTEFGDRQPIWLEISPDPDGTTVEVMDFDAFRDLFWSSIVLLILRRDGFCCQHAGCDATEMLEVHHIIPRRAGGSDHPVNLITLCHKHHVMQGTHGNGSVRGLADRKLAEFGAV